MLPLIHDQISRFGIPISSVHGFGRLFCRALIGLVLAAVLFPPLASSEVVVNTLSSADVAGRLQGKIGASRAAEIAANAPLLKAGLTAQEAADILGTPNELSEAARASAIYSVAMAM